jgi:hypothetical protein
MATITSAVLTGSSLQDLLVNFSEPVLGFTHTGTETNVLVYSPSNGWEAPGLITQSGPSQVKYDGMTGDETLIVFLAQPVNYHFANPLNIGSPVISPVT